MTPSDEGRARPSVEIVKDVRRQPGLGCQAVGTEQPGDGFAFEVPVVWVGIDEAPVYFLNQFLLQTQAEEIILTFGALSPPALLGTPQDRRQQAEALRFVPVKVLGRYGMTEHRLRELTDLLVRFFEERDRVSGEKDK